jgi:hypothetical protein
VLTEFSKHLEQGGIKHEWSVPYTPQQSGISERLNGTLLNSVRTTLKYMDCAKKWRGEAVTTACYVKNWPPPPDSVGTPPRMSSGLARDQRGHVCETLAQDASISPRRRREISWMTGRVKG